MREGHDEIKRNYAKSAIQKEQLQKLVNEENLKHSKVRKDISEHKKAIKEQVEKHFNDLGNILDQRHANALLSLTTDLNSVSLFNTQTEDKAIEVQDFIQITDGSKFFRDVTKMERSLDIPIQQMQSSYISSPKFIPGNVSQSNIGSFKDDENLSMEPNISLVISNEYKSEFPTIAFIRPCIDNSYLICSKESKLLRVELDGTKLNTISQYQIRVYGIAVLSSNDVLLVTNEPSPKQLDHTTGKLSDTVYNIAPFLPISIHITSGKKVVVGGLNEKLERSAVFVMNKQGKQETVYQHDKHNQLIFAFPKSITSTSNGNMHVVDCDPARGSGKVVVLEQDGGIINEYTGHPYLNEDQPFKPRDIVATPKDNLVITTQNDSYLYILNNRGDLVTYYNTHNIGIFHPYALAFTTAGQLCIGCRKSTGSTTREAKLYVVNITGF